MTKFLFLLIILTTRSFAQTVSIPDTNFLKELLRTGIDANNDNFIQVQEAKMVKQLFVTNVSIKSLIGIEAFSELEDLRCYDNEITELDLSNNPKLITLVCQNNQISTLNLSKNTRLLYLYASNNKLEHINISSNLELNDLSLLSNNLLDLDVSKNTLLGHKNFYATKNPNLKEICINEDQLSDTSFWNKDANTKWNAKCEMVLGYLQFEIQQSEPKLLKIYSLNGLEISADQAKNGLYIFLMSDGKRRKNWIY